MLNVQITKNNACKSPVLVYKFTKVYCSINLAFQASLYGTSTTSCIQLQ